MADWNAAERRQAKKDGAKTVKNSGRGKIKGDATHGEFVVDYKHRSKSFSMTEKEWAKLCKDAWSNGNRYPLMKIIYGEGREVAILDWHLFMEMAKEQGLIQEEQ